MENVVAEFSSYFLNEFDRRNLEIFEFKQSMTGFFLNRVAKIFCLKS